MNKRVISWFSCGAASAVASKIAITKYPQVEVVYQETNSEHPDNARFFRECREWFGRDIIKISSAKYHDIWQIFRERRYLAGVKGALCTTELKKIVARKYIGADFPIEILGYTAEEAKRVERFIAQNPDRRIESILLDRGLTKADCLAIISEVGIEVPAMYKLGYTNNNCIGCVKGQMGYWNKIRRDFPDVFSRMALQERELNAALCKTYAGDGKRKRVFLDELDPEAGNHAEETPISCGVLCEIELEALQEVTE